MMKFVYTVPQLFIFLFCFYLQLGSSELPPDQVSTMAEIYDILQNNSGSSFMWNNVRRDSNPCSWQRVICSSGNSTITSLSLSSLSISSPELFPLICTFTSLESLDVSNNFLSFFPIALVRNCGFIGSLKLLNFSKNHLNASLPSFNGFRSLEHLDLSYNSLYGAIGSAFDGLESLRSVNLSHNKFTGIVPEALGNLNNLDELQLSSNGFTGEIPRTMSGNLSLIDLSSNSLSGSIPEQLSLLTRLHTLLLSLNRLSGEIPRSLATVRTLLRFAANYNTFNGSIPSGITRYLQTLDLSFNNLVGTMPSDLLSGQNLRSLDLSENRLEGSIPATISTGLVRLRLGSNNLTGTLPRFWGLLALMYLEVDNNSLTGTIPSELGMCRSLALLNLAGNRFTGTLPPVLGNLSNLQRLSLQSNNFVGRIPSEITQLNKLLELNMSWNSFDGAIPSSISRLTNLTKLNLQGNNLSSNVPSSIADLPSLIELQLGKNQLDGPIPAMMPRNLQIALNLSHNLFTGQIPESLSRLQGLELLDLSNNRLSGAIPNSLAGMASLSSLDVSNNELSGVIPRFQKFVDFRYGGNGNLTFPPDNPAPAPPAVLRNRRTIGSDIMIAFASAIVAVGLLVMISVFISRRYTRIGDERLPSAEESSPAPQVIHGKLLTPNGIHRSSIDFSKAMEAVTDPTKITLKTRFSTYFKVVMPSGTPYFVKKLNLSDKIFQPGRHGKFDKELEVLGKLCNSNVMIPLAYVLTEETAYLFYEFYPKGTLYDVLHDRMSGALDWASRYSIAIGVSQGLAFLHECNSAAILLLDLSSKSIMLKSLNEPLVGDIELFKVIDPSKSTSSLSTVAGSVGYVPPEYAYTMRMTAAGNVYSFGVVLLELVSGKPAVSGGVELAKWVLNYSAQQNKWDQILDFSISKTSAAVRRQMLAVLKVALACVSISPDSRPKMKSVLRMLLNAR